MRVTWIASYGPNRSHDSLNSAVFERRRDALSFVEGRDYWRITRLEAAGPYAPGKRSDETGGSDVAAAIERQRQEMQYRLARRVSTEEARKEWQVAE